MKNRTAKIFAVSFIVYLVLQTASALLNIYYSIFALVQYAHSASISPEMFNDQELLQTTGFNCAAFVCNALMYALLALMVSSSLIEKGGRLKNDLRKMWFVPGILYVLQTLVYVVSQFVPVFSQPEEILTISLMTALSNVLQALVFRVAIAVLCFTLPKLLLSNDLFVFKNKTNQQQADLVEE